MPPKGAGWRIPETWLRRGLTFGTSSLIGLVKKVARRVAGTLPGSTLYVADISFPRGGRSAWHRTHREGRDVDLLFYALDREGRPAPPPEQMIPFDELGLSPDGELIFDFERNWALVRALIDDPRVEKIFVAPWVEELLLAFAREQEEAAALVARAQVILATPGRVEPHDDHFHVRVGCLASAPDRHDTARSAPSRGRSPTSRTKRNH